jgi:uncharacterized heparinase superfamily protein
MTSDSVTEVRRILDDWRKQHGWQPGMVWDPYTATYVHPTQDSTERTAP